MDPPPQNNGKTLQNASQSLMAKFSSPMREFGLAAGSLYLLDQALRRISPGLGVFVYEMMVQPITNRSLLPEGLAKNLTFREIHAGDPEIALMFARPGVMETRFAQGAICFGTFQRDTLIGYIWFAFGKYLEDETRCIYLLPKDHPSVFDFDLFVMPEKRMGIGFMGVWHGANRYLWDRGVRYTFSRLSRYNTASRRSHARLGWRRVGKAVFIKLWRLQVMFTTLRPYAHISISGRSAPQLVLTPDALLDNKLP